MRRRRFAQLLALAPWARAADGARNPRHRVVMLGVAHAHAAGKLAALRALPSRGPARLLTDFAGLPHALRDTALITVPIWSPEVAWLFDASLPPAETTRRWRASGLRYVVTSPAPSFLAFLTRQAQWRSPTFALIAVWQSDAYLVLEVILEPAPAH